MSIKWEKADVLLTLKNSMMTIKKKLDYGLFQLHLKMSPRQEYSLSLLMKHLIHKDRWQ